MAAVLTASGFLFEGWELMALLGFLVSLIGWSGIGGGLMILALTSVLLRHTSQSRRSRQARDEGISYEEPEDSDGEGYW